MWSIHRALQQSLLHRLDADPAARQGAFQVALDVVRQAFPRQSDAQAPTNHNWLVIEAHLSHALHLEDVFRKCPSSDGIVPPPNFAELLADVGNYMWERGFYDRGLPTLRLAKRIHEGNLNRASIGEGPRTRHRYYYCNLMEHSKVCTLLGGIYLEMGISRRQDGLRELVESWRLRQEYFSGADATDINGGPGPHRSRQEWLLMGNSWNDVGCALLEFACYDKAETFVQKSLQIKRSRGFKEDSVFCAFNYAENYKNLALVRTAQGRHRDAVELCQKAVGLMELHNDPDSATVLSFRFHLGYALYQAGRFDEALLLHHQVRGSRLRLFGATNVHTLDSFYACSVVLEALGKLDEARCALPM